MEGVALLNGYIVFHRGDGENEELRRGFVSSAFSLRPLREIFNNLSFQQFNHLFQLQYQHCPRLYIM